MSGIPDESAALEEHPRPGVEDPGEGIEVITAEIIEDTPLQPDAVSPEALGLDLPEDPAEARSVLLKAVLDERMAAADQFDTLQRVVAEYDNYRKRVARDQIEMIERASQRVVEALLPVLDTFDAALGYETQTPAEEKILDGMRGTYDGLITVLRAEGLEPIEAAGKPFDPMFHEAVTGPVGGEGDLVVTQELRRGYLFNERVLRPTMVQVDHADDDA